MSRIAKRKFSLKVMINKQKTKVLFVEADSNFVDVLLSIPALPLGTILRELKQQDVNEEPVIGSFTTLYNGLENLDSFHFWTEGGKKMLLNPRDSFTVKPMKYFSCDDKGCKRKRAPNVSLYHKTRKCDCGKLLSRFMGAIESKTQATDGSFLKETRLPFLVTDDLQIAPNEPGLLIQTLINLGIVVTEEAELRNVTIGFNDLMHLVKGSLISKTPLTDLILHKRCSKSFVPVDLQHQMMEEESSCNSEKMTVKAMVQKSTNKLLFAEAEEDFVDFLFSLLIIPLGGVEFLLCSNSSLTCIDNLYKSMILLDEKYLKTPDTKRRIIVPELPPSYLTKNQIFSLSEQVTPTIYYVESVTDSSNRTVETGSWMCFKDPKGEGSYVKKPGKFMVADDLTVKPLSVSSSVFVRNKLKIPLSDVKELELHIGLKEALSILKASLTSTTALTDALINPTIKKQVKLEH